MSRFRYTLPQLLDAIEKEAPGILEGFPEPETFIFTDDEDGRKWLELGTVTEKNGTRVPLRAYVPRASWVSYLPGDYWTIKGQVHMHSPFSDIPVYIGYHDNLKKGLVLFIHLLCGHKTHFFNFDKKEGFENLIAALICVKTMRNKKSGKRTGGETSGESIQDDHKPATTSHKSEQTVITEKNDGDGHDNSIKSDGENSCTDEYEPALVQNSNKRARKLSGSSEDDLPGAGKKAKVD